MLTIGAISVGIATLVAVPCIQNRVAKRKHARFNLNVDGAIGKNV